MVADPPLALVSVVGLQTIVYAIILAFPRAHSGLAVTVFVRSYISFCHVYRMLYGEWLIISF